MKTSFSIASCTALTAAVLLSACSSDSTPDTIAPTAVSLTQNRTIDATGKTVDVLMSELIDSTAANLASNWTVTAGTVSAAELQADGLTVRLTMAAAAVPGDITFGIAAPSVATGNISLSAQATNGDTVVIGDGVKTVTFEFTSGSGATGSNIEVDKGASATTAVAALLAAINLRSFDITASAGSGDSVDLVNDAEGQGGNVALAETDAGSVITLTGMANGVGLEDTNGNLAVAVSSLALLATDSTVPLATSLEAEAVSGADNDKIVVTFNDNMIQSEVETPGNWTVESPIGAAWNMTNATVSYDDTTLIATVTLGSGTIGTTADANNLQTFDSIAATFTGLRDVAGNALVATTISVDAVANTIGGDDVAPTILSATGDNSATRLTVNFSEATQAVAFGDLYSGGTDAGTRFQLTDADGTPAVAATGAIDFSGSLSDGDTITIGDGVAPLVFEFDDGLGGGVTSPNTAVLMGVSLSAGVANLATAIDNSTSTVGVTLLASVAFSLGNSVAGTIGNVGITVNCSAVSTVAGMAGGAAATSAEASPVTTLFGWNSDGLSAVVPFTATPATAADTIEIYGIQDLAGNQLLPVLTQALAVVDNSEPSIDASGSTIVSNSGEANDSVTIKFGDPMSAVNIDVFANYGVTTGSSLDLSTADFSFDGVDILTITLDGAMPANVVAGSGSIALLSPNGTRLRTKHGKKIGITAVGTVVATGDTTPILATNVVASVAASSSANKVIVVFPEAVDMVGATGLANYAISAANPTAITELTPLAVELTFAVQPVIGDTLTIEVVAATDLAGNAAVAQMSRVLIAPGATAPTLSGIQGTANTDSGRSEISVSFNGPVNLTSALALANYTITSGGQSVSLVDATVTFDSANDLVLIGLADGVNLQFGDSLTAVLSDVTDLFGNTLTVQASASAVNGDNVDPDFLSSTSAFVNWIEDASGTTIDVYFSEAVDSTIVNNPLSWSASGSTVISSATQISPTIVRVVTAAAINSSETLGLSSLMDISGNIAGSITVSPVE